MRVFIHSLTTVGKGIHSTAQSELHSTSLLVHELVADGSSYTPLSSDLSSVGHGRDQRGYSWARRSRSTALRGSPACLGPTADMQGMKACFRIEMTDLFPMFL